MFIHLDKGTEQEFQGFTEFRGFVLSLLLSNTWFHKIPELNLS